MSLYDEYGNTVLGMVPRVLDDRLLIRLLSRTADRRPNTDVLRRAADTADAAKAEDDVARGARENKREIATWNVAMTTSTRIIVRLTIQLLFESKECRTCTVRTSLRL